MKTKILGIIILFSVSVYSQSIDSAKISFFLSMNVNSSVEVSQSGNNDKFNAEPSFGVGFEYYITNNEGGSKSGLGVEYGFKNSIPGINGYFRNIPAYLFYDLSLIDNNSFYIPKLSLKLGFNFLSLSDNFLSDKSGSSNGIYFGLGIKSQINSHYAIRIMYSINQGGINYSGKDYLLKNEKINLCLCLLL